MANFDTIKTAIDANIKTNGTQDITGGKMNSILKQMVDATDEQLTELESETRKEFVNSQISELTLPLTKLYGRLGMDGDEAYFQESIFTFWGERLKIFSSKGGDRGVLHIYVDNNLIKSIDMNSMQVINNICILDASGLGDGFHVCRIKVEGVSGKNFGYLSNVIYSANQKFEENFVSTSDMAINADEESVLEQFVDSDNIFNDKTIYIGRLRKCEFDFTGNGCALFLRKNIESPLNSFVDIYIDNQRVYKGNLYHNDGSQTISIISPVLDYKKHHVVINAYGYKNNKSFLYLLGLSVISKQIKEPDSMSVIPAYMIKGASYTRGLDNGTQKKNEVIYVFSKNDFDFIFYGTGINVYHTIGTDRGQVTCYVDGVEKGHYNLYSQNNDVEVLSFSINDLSLGFHRLKLSVAPYQKAEWQYITKLEVFGCGEVMNKIQAPLKYLEDFGAIGDGFTDDSEAMQLAIDKCLESGGTLMVGNKRYLINKSIVINNKNAWQNGIKIQGTGAYMDGQELNNINSCMLIFNNPDNVARFITTGVGMIEINGVTFATTDDIDSPFILSIYTTMLIHGCSFVGSKRETSCIQDAIVLGGTQEHEDRGEVSFDSGFQGYGTVIRENYFLGIRRALYARAFCNAIVFRDNNIWRGCGSNLPLGAAIELDEVAENPTQYNCGILLEGNLIEQCYYPVAIKMLNSCFNRLSFNNIYDVGSGDVAKYGIYIGADSHHNQIELGYPSWGYGSIELVHNESVVGHNYLLNVETKQNGFID